MKFNRLPGRKLPDRYFNRRALAQGTKVELEHTRNKSFAKSIAKDHLAESRRYYTELRKMEYRLKHPRRNRTYTKKILGNNKYFKVTGNSF